MPFPLPTCPLRNSSNALEAFLRHQSSYNTLRRQSFNFNHSSSLPRALPIFSPSGDKHRKKDMHVQYWTTEEFMLKYNRCVLCDISLNEPVKTLRNGVRTMDWETHRKMRHHEMSLVLLDVVWSKYRDRSSAEEILRDYSRALLCYPASYYICQDLVSVDVAKTSRKLLESIKAMQQVGILTHSTNLIQGRTFNFDQMEWVGDLVLAPLVHEVLGSCFDLESQYDSNILTELSPILSRGGGNGFFTANVHLERVFDQCGFRQVVAGGDSIVNKLKSDTIEAILGELELFVWACESHHGFQRQYTVECHRSAVALATSMKYTIAALVVLVFLRACLRCVFPFMRRIEKELYGVTYVKRRWDYKSKGASLAIPLVLPSPRYPPSPSLTFARPQNAQKLRGYEASPYQHGLKRVSVGRMVDYDSKSTHGLFHKSKKVAAVMPLLML